MTSTSYALSQWLSQGDRGIQLVLEHCTFHPQDNAQHLAIYCPIKLLDTLIDHIHSIKWAASRALVKSMGIYSIFNGEAKHEFSFFPEQMSAHMPTAKVDPLGIMLLAELGVGFDNPIAIVEQGTNRGIFCSTGILEQSKAVIDRWIDQDMAQYHYPEELEKLEAYAQQGGGVEATWKAKTFQYEPLQITARVYCGEINGKFVRVTENLDWRLI